MPRALIVDDMPESLLLLRTILRHHGWEVDEANEGSAALERAKAIRPDLVISDLRMPGMDGYTLLRHWKSEAGLSGVPFAVFTGTYTSAADRALALKLGADAFFLKSDQPVAIMKHIATLTGHRGSCSPALASPDVVGALADYGAVVARKLDTKYLELTLALQTARDNESRAHQILDALPAAAYTANADGFITYANPRAVSLWGGRGAQTANPMFGPAQHFERDNVTPISPEDSCIARALRGEAAAERTVTLVLEDGSRRLVQSHANSLRDADGSISGAVAVLIDITEDAATRLALRDSQERLLSIVNSAMDAIVSVDTDQRVVLFNPAAERMFGYTAEEMRGQTLDQLIPLASRARHQGALKRFGETGETNRAMGSLGTIFGLRRSGERFPIEASISQTVVNGAKLFTVILRDITERMQGELTLRESEERFRQVTEYIDEVFWLFDLEAGRTIYASPAFERVWGFPPTEVYRESDRWSKSIHPDDAAQVAAHMTELQRGKRYTIEYRIVRPDKTERWIRDRGFPVHKPDGTLYRIAGVAVDITSQRQLEEERFRQSQKMEAVGQLAGGIAHDFNNLLTVIQMHGSLLAQRRDPALEESLRPILDAAGRAANLTRQLLTFSRRQVKESRRIDLADVVVNMVRLLRRVLGEDIALETATPAGLPLVNADPGMMEQVVMNLAVNARDAMPLGGRMRIALAVIDATAENVADHPDVLPGRFVRLTVSDSGCGIPEEHLPRIFEPFFTTKGDNHGTGLGLATVFGIAQQHGGWVEVESKVALGSSFHVYVPALPPEARANATVIELRPNVRGGTERILLVEDELPVRNVARTVLRKLGYDVVEAASARDALNAWREGQRPFALLLTDIIMPGGMNGRELAETLQQLQPSLRVVYMSGYSDDIVSRRLQVKPGVNLLQKPFELEALGNIVRETLDRK